MADKKDIRALARRYLDLWERQVAESATDPQAARALAQWQSMINGAAAADGARKKPAGPKSREDGDDAR